MTLRSLLIATASLLTVVSGSHASTLASGSFQADTFICRAVNVGPGPVSALTVDIVNSGTGTVIGTHSCPKVAVDHECSEAIGTATEIAFCRITSSGPASHIRGTFIGVLGTTTQVTDVR